MNIETQVLNFFRKNNSHVTVGVLTSLLWDTNEPYFPNYNYFRTLIEEALTYLTDRRLINKLNGHYSFAKSNDVSIIEED